MAGDERRTTGGGGLGGDHAEGFREDRRDDARVREREQVHEVAVLERAGEEGPLGIGESLELFSIVAEAHDDGARVDALERLEKDVDALVQEELPEVDDGRLVARQERRETLGVPLVRQALVRVPRVRRVSSALGDEPGERLVTRARAPLVDIHARRHLAHAVDVAANLLQDFADVRRADEHGAGLREHGLPPRLELGPAAHGVLELGPVGLHGIGGAGGGAYGSAEEHVVAENEIGRKVLTDRGGIRLDPEVELRACAVLEELDVVALVVVEDEHREKAADVRPRHVRGAEVVPLRVRLLGEDGDVVPGPRPLARELTGVDVRAGPAEQVAVPEEDLHACILLASGEARRDEGQRALRWLGRPARGEAPPLPLPTLGGVLGHPPPAFERNADMRTRGARVRAESVPIAPQPRPPTPNPPELAPVSQVRWK